MIRDKVRLEQLSGIKFPKLHGHVKLTLTNAYSDNIEKVYEGDNIVTNAVKDIYASNSKLCGGIDYSKLYPLWQNWYGGILCYEQAHDNLDPDDYYPRNSSVNAVTAHAGQTPYTGADDMSRGSPLTDSQSLVFTENSVKQTFEWGTNQGNGYIRSISLTHRATGDAGLGVNSEAFQNFEPFEDLSGLSDISAGGSYPADKNNIFAQYDDRHGLLFLIGDDGDFTGANTNFSTTKISVYIVPLVYSSQGLLDNTAPVYTFTRSFTVTTSINFYGMPAWYFDYATKKLWLFTNKTGTGATAYSKTTMNYTVIDCENEIEDIYGTIVSDASDLGCVCLHTSYTGRSYPRFSQLVKDGNYIYLPMGDTPTSNNSNFTGLKKINIVSQADQSVFGTNVTAQQYAQAYYKCGGLILNGNRVFNNGTGYTCAYGAFSVVDQSNNRGREIFFQQPNSPVSLLYVFNPIDNAESFSRYVLAPRMLNTTKYNLDSVAQKLSSQRMTIEYEITEDNS